MPRLAGKLWTSWVVRRWGALGGAGGQLLGGGPVQSWTAGSSWTLGQYGLAILAAHFGSKLFGKVLDAGDFRQGCWDLILTKLIWTEGIARSDWAKSQFGSPRIRGNRRTGQAWLQQGGQWEALQGAHGMGDTIVDAGALDGPMGDTIVTANQLDGLMHPGTPDAIAQRARWTGSGDVNPWNAAYQSGW
jgi:hypothetical protein